MKFMIKRGVKGVIRRDGRGRKRMEGGYREGGVDPENITMLQKRLAPDIGNGVSNAGLRFSSTCSLHAAPLTTAGHPISSAGLAPIPRPA